jgi:hypothetical protein
LISSQRGKPDRDRLRTKLIEARIRLLRYQSGAPQAEQIAMDLAASQSGIRRKISQRHIAAPGGKRVEYPRGDGDGLHAAAMRRAGTDRPVPRSFHDRDPSSHSDVS